MSETGGSRLTRLLPVLGPLVAVLIFLHNQKWLWLVVIYLLVLAVVLGVRWPHQQWAQTTSQAQEHVRVLCMRTGWVVIYMLVGCPILFVGLSLFAERMPLVFMNQVQEILENAQGYRSLRDLSRRQPIDAALLSGKSKGESGIYVARSLEKEIELTPGEHVFLIIMERPLNEVRTFVLWILILLVGAIPLLFVLERIAELSFGLRAGGRSDAA